jgi:plasmid stabilization system protein ParE
MAAPFQLTPLAIEDIDDIWRFIAEDNRDTADAVEREIIATCRRLARRPLMGTKRQDITPLPVRFWTITKFPNYVVVYRSDTVPLQVVAVLHGKRNLKQVLRERPA